MSYCRWSSDDFQCDVYVYEDCSGGWTTHVASRRHVFKEPIPPEVPFDKEHQAAWFDRHRKIMKMCDSAEMHGIGLKFDGKTFNHETPSDCAGWLKELREAGYNVPQYAIDALLEE